MSARKARAHKANAGSAGRTEFTLRLVSALVMAAGATLLTLAGPWPFALLVAAVAVVLCWEWDSIVRPGSPRLPLAAHMATALGAALLTAAGQVAAALALLAAGAVTLWVLASTGGHRMWSAAGVLYFGLPVVALVALRDSATLPVMAILFLFAVVWTADTAAYFTGKAIGGPKLAPAISPGKTWSGFFGGLLVPACVGFIFGRAMGGTSPAVLGIVAGALAMISQAGDLVESYVKRRFHQKDASHLIPGHGGFLDRVDGLMFAAVAAWLIGLLRDPASPAQGLLIWP
ncbi:MAG: phosphatidate cytidylyltransferase [Hyphomicrobiales bacterium]